MDEFDLFQTSIVHAFADKLRPSLERDSETMSERLGHMLSGKPETTSQIGPLSREDVFIRRMYKGFAEICTSFESLVDIEDYLRGFPFRASRLNRVRYMRFVIEAYLNEMYILRERLLSYIKLIERAYQKTARREEVEKALVEMPDKIKNALGGVTKTRGGHVHASRFSTPNLDELVALDLITNHTDADRDAERWKLWYDIEYRRIRQEWGSIVKTNNQDVRKLLNMYFLGLSSLLFDDAGEWRYP